MLQTRYYFTNEFNRFFDILKTYKYTTVQFKKNEHLKKVNSTFKYNYVIIKGFCKVSVIHESGEEKIIGYWGPGSMYPIIISEQAFILEDSIIVKAVNDMETMAFDCQQTKLFMKNEPEIAYEMINHYCKFGNLLFFCITSQTYENVQTRLCNMLYIYCQNTKSTIVPLTQSELASLIGATRESVVKVVKKLREDSVIKTSRHQITVLSMEKLMMESSFLLK